MNREREIARMERIDELSNKIKKFTARLYSTGSDKITPVDHEYRTYCRLIAEKNHLEMLERSLPELLKLSLSELKRRLAESKKPTKYKFPYRPRRFGKIIGEDNRTKAERESDYDREHFTPPEFYEEAIKEKTRLEEEKKQEAQNDAKKKWTGTLKEAAEEIKKSAKRCKSKRAATFAFFDKHSFPDYPNLTPKKLYENVKRY